MSRGMRAGARAQRGSAQNEREVAGLRNSLKGELARGWGERGEWGGLQGLGSGAEVGGGGGGRQGEGFRESRSWVWGTQELLPEAQRGNVVGGGVTPEQPVDVNVESRLAVRERSPAPEGAEVQTESG